MLLKYVKGERETERDRCGQIGRMKKGIGRLRIAVKCWIVLFMDLQVGEWLDEWMDEWMEEWTNGATDMQTDGQIDGQLNRHREEPVCHKCYSKNVQPL